MLTSAQIRLARFYGMFTMLLSAVLLCFALGECFGFFNRPLDVTGVSLVGSALLAIPFVITYTKLGLNSAEGEMETPETKHRHRLLKLACPWWHPSWYACIATIGLSWILVAFVGMPLDAFVIFGAMILMLTGIWFLTVYYNAHRVMEGLSEENCRTKP